MFNDKQMIWSFLWYWSGAHIYPVFVADTCCLITGWDTDSSCAQVHFENTDVNNKMATRAVEHSNAANAHMIISNLKSFLLSLAA